MNVLWDTNLKFSTLHSELGMKRGHLECLTQRTSNEYAADPLPLSITRHMRQRTILANNIYKSGLQNKKLRMKYKKEFPRPVEAEKHNWCLTPKF